MLFPCLFPLFCYSILAPIFSHMFFPFFLPIFFTVFYPMFFPLILVVISIFSLCFSLYFSPLCSSPFLPDILPYILAYFLSCFFQHVPCDFSPMLFPSVFHDFVLFSLPLCFICFLYVFFHVFGAGHLRGSRLLSFSAFFYENNIVWGGGVGWGGVG